MRRSTRPLPFTTATLLTACCGAAAAFENGPIPGHTGAFGQPDCTACHFDNDVNSQGGSVTLTGLPDDFLPGQQYAITVTLEDEELSSGGFQLTIQDSDGDSVGELNTDQDDIKLVHIRDSGNSYIQHNKSRNKCRDDAAIRWTMVWTAPHGNAVVIIAVAAVAANDDASPLGDNVYTTTARVNAAGEDSNNENRRQE